jgi:hypothetical protein
MALPDVKSIHNSILEDPILDVLELIHKHCKNNTTLLHNLDETNDQFKNIVIYYLCMNYDALDLDDLGILDTEQAIYEGFNIICNASIHHPSYKGKCDLLIRSDYINNLFSNKVINIKYYNDNYFYVLVSVLPFTIEISDDSLILNNDTLPYMARAYLLNEALGQMQKYKPSRSYVIGKGWQIKDDQLIQCDAWLNKAAYISFAKYQNMLKEKTDSALSWVVKLNNIRISDVINKYFKKEEKTMDLDYDSDNLEEYNSDITFIDSIIKLIKYIESCQPVCLSIYPNMKNKQYTKFLHLKDLVAATIGELTYIPYITPKIRDELISKGVTNIYSQPGNKLNSLSLSQFHKNIINNIFLVNNSYTQQIAPYYIENSIDEYPVELYLNLKLEHYTTDSNGLSVITEYIYEIEFACSTDNVVTYSDVIKCNASNEKHVFLNLQDKILELTGDNVYVVYYYTENDNYLSNTKDIYNLTKSKYLLEFEEFYKGICPTWVNLCDVFKKNAITAVCMYDYELDSVVDAFTDVLDLNPTLSKMIRLANIVSYIRENMTTYKRPICNINYINLSDTKKMRIGD